MGSEISRRVVGGRCADWSDGFLSRTRSRRDFSFLILHATPSPVNTNRRAKLSAVSSLVVKLGTQLLCDPRGRLDPVFLADIARQVAGIRKGKRIITLVSSGAIACGLGELEIGKRPTDLAKLQAVAAVGQQRLMDHWRTAFAAHGLPVAQILVTRQDVGDRRRLLNLRHTLLAAHDLGVIPIINENDTVSTDEITFGDNDVLAASVAQALHAELLILLTSVDGLLDADGSAVRCVRSIDAARKLVRKEKSAQGKGGMDSKIMAAKLVTDAGRTMIVAGGRTKNVLVGLLAGEELGTIFVPSR
jgi:glutamate 5-kinase